MRRGVEAVHDMVGIAFDLFDALDTCAYECL